MNVGNNHRVKECRIGGTDVSDNNPLYIKIRLKNRTRHTLWRLNVGLLNNEQRKEKIKTEIVTYIKENGSNGIISYNRKKNEFLQHYGMR